MSSSMQVLQARLDSFKPKRSSKKSSQKWPHPSSFKATPQSLAEAGFHFTPWAQDRDSVTCYMCKKQLNAWDKSDDPFRVHWEKCGELCAWATVRCGLEEDVDAEGNFIATDPKRLPLSKTMERARLDTFRVCLSWPHDAVKTHSATSKKMAKAGFVYTPQSDGDDTATCLYCDVSLSGWDPGDEPIEEHRKRASRSGKACLFFTASLPTDSTTTAPVSSTATSAASKKSTAGGRARGRPKTPHSEEEEPKLQKSTSKTSSRARKAIEEEEEERVSSSRAKAKLQKSTSRTPASRAQKFESEEEEEEEERIPAKAKMQKSTSRTPASRAQRFESEEDEEEEERVPSSRAKAKLQKSTSRTPASRAQKLESAEQAEEGPAPASRAKTPAPRPASRARKFESEEEEEEEKGEKEEEEHRVPAKAKMHKSTSRTPASRAQKFESEEDENEERALVGRAKTKVQKSSSKTPASRPASRARKVETEDESEEEQEDAPPARKSRSKPPAWDNEDAVPPSKSKSRVKKSASKTPARAQKARSYHEEDDDEEEEEAPVGSKSRMLARSTKTPAPPSSSTSKPSLAAATSASSRSAKTSDVEAAKRSRSRGKKGKNAVRVAQKDEEEDEKVVGGAEDEDVKELPVFAESVRENAGKEEWEMELDRDEEQEEVDEVAGEVDMEEVAEEVRERKGRTGKRKTQQMDAVEISVPPPPVVKGKGRSKTKKVQRQEDGEMGAAKETGKIVKPSEKMQLSEKEGKENQPEPVKKSNPTKTGVKGHKATATSEDAVAPAKSKPLRSTKLSPGLSTDSLAHGDYSGPSDRESFVTAVDGAQSQSQHQGKDEVEAGVVDVASEDEISQPSREKATHPTASSHPPASGAVALPIPASAALSPADRQLAVEQFIRKEIELEAARQRKEMEGMMRRFREMGVEVRRRIEGLSVVG